MDQRSNLLVGNEKLGQTSDRLQNAHRIAVQNEQIGMFIINSLLLLGILFYVTF